MRVRGRLVAVLAMAALVMLPALACADPGDVADARSIARARAAIEAVDYEGALAAVRPLLASPKPSVRVSALEVTAVSDLLLGRLADGRQALEELYTLAPAFLFEDPTLPPRVTSEIDAAAARPRSRAVTPILRPVAEAPLRFELRAAGATRHVAVACRTSPSDPFVAVATSEVTGAWRFDLPRDAPAACHAVAVDEDGLTIGRLGTTRSPFDVRPHAASPTTNGIAADPAASESHALTTRWWFWTGLAALVVTGVTITYVATRPSDSSTVPRSEVTISALKGAAFAW